MENSSRNTLNDASDSPILSSEKQNGKFDNPPLLSPHQKLNPNPNVEDISNYEGVSNGDVDWLFRGKSKKLTKSNGKDSREKEKVDNDSKGETASKKSTKPNISIKTDKLENMSFDKSKANLAISPKTNIPIPPTSNTSSSIEREKISKLDKFRFGRARSVSNPVVNASSDRKSSEELRRKLSVSSNEISSTNSEDESKNVKKSLFNSFGLKFNKGSSSAVSPTHATSTSSSLNNQKLNPNLIGSATSSVKQDLTGIDKPPIGYGKPRGRNSITSLSSSLEGLSLTRKDKKELPPRTKLNVNPNRKKSECEVFQDINLKRVTFAIDKLLQDPQQQIPSRRPKKGNVLIPEDLIAPPPRLSQGISLQDGGKLSQEPKYSERELTLAIESQRRSLLESEKHAYEAHLSGKRTANEVCQYMKKSNRRESVGSKIPDEDQLESRVSKIEIEKPMHLHENHFDDEMDQEVDLNDLTLETIYTRCCHLREILPIPATLKQLKNKTKPLQVLKLLNPKPTLIDVLSFSDFISITPINTIIFDNVTMTSEMLKNFLGALYNNKSLEKLSLRNVAIDEIGWKYLCKFLANNSTVKKLDISQQRIKEGTDEKCIRRNMNWDLFIRSIVFRGGMEELVINGCKLSDTIFTRLFKEAVPLSTMRLGVAAVDLNLYTSNLIADWIKFPNSKCIGLDIGFNDLSQGQLQPFIKAFNTGNLSLLFLSLNSTNLSNVDEASELLRSLIKVDKLRFLDFSSVPLLFPNIISKLERYLPRFPSLRRIHFDLNELEPASIGAIADILPKMKNLLHVTLLGNRNLNYSAAGTLYTAVKTSKIFCLELDYDLVPDELARRIAFYLMKNLDKTVNEGAPTHDDDDLIFDGSLLMETAEKLMNEIDNKSDKKDDIKVQKIIANALIARTKAVRKEIHHQIDTLFEKRKLGSLSLEGKETLLRYCLLDCSMEKVTSMFEEQAKINGFLVNSTPASPKLNPSESTLVEMSQISELQPSDINLHESSSELIAALSPHNPARINNSLGYFAGAEQSFQPHQVVTETSEGKDVAIDNLTGRPILFRSISQTSTHARELEEEEGEFHKLALFIQQKDMEETATKKDLPLLQIPSGSELRDAIIAAKGLQSADDLIAQVNTNRVNINEIMGIENPNDRISNPANEKDNSNDTKSINDNTNNPHDDAVVDVLYDNLLNQAQRARSISRSSP